jgi:hypothetical protein
MSLDQDPEVRAHNDFDGLRSVVVVSERDPVRTYGNPKQQTSSRFGQPYNKGFKAPDW